MSGKIRSYKKRAEMRVFSNIGLFIAGMFLIFLIFGDLNIFLRILFAIAAFFVIFFFLLFNKAFGTGLLSTQNKDMNQTIASLLDLIDLSRENIKIVSGQLRNDIYTDTVVQALKEKVKENTNGKILPKIEIILGYPEFDKKKLNKELLKWAIDNQFEIYRLKKPKGPHFVVVDNEHVRLENIHHIDDKSRQADIRFFSPRLAKYLDKRFQHLKKNATKLEKESDIDKLPIRQKAS